MPAKKIQENDLMMGLVTMPRMPLAINQKLLLEHERTPKPFILWRSWD
jgi:hypothetical protein